MPQGSKPAPSLEGIFRILAKLPVDRLLHYKHKLSCTRQDRRSCKLLHAMILLTLKREAEARVSLDALGDDPAATYIYRSHWGGAAANEANPISPEQEAGLAWAVAQIYSLLASEKWCNPQARDEAYRRAVQAFQESGAERGKLESLLGDAREKCGVDFVSLLANGGASAPQPEAQETLGGSAKTSPLLRSSLTSVSPQPLCSTGTPMSFISHFEISASPTVQFLTGSHDQNRAAKSPGPSERPGESLSQKLLQKGGNGSSQTPQTCSLKLDNLQITHSAEEAAPSAQHTEGPITGAENHPDPKRLLQNMPATSASQPILETKPIQRALSMPQSPAVGPCSPSGPAPPLCASAEPPGDEGTRFFTFVVLHASEDEEVACRVKEHLESMGVSNGATFCEDFQIPGHCELSCFQDALDNSAFTLLLLTENFRNRLCAFQTSVALMDSFTRFLKANTVIPFVPRENPMRKQDMPILLAGLVSLDENSPVFARRVRNTFTSAAIQEKRSIWSRHQQIQEERRLQELQRERAQMLHRLSALRVNTQGPDCGMTGPAQLRIPPGYPGFPAPQVPEPGPVSLSGLASIMPSGTQPQFIIQNAQMVQIGDYNHMNIEKTNAVLGPDPEEGGTEDQ